VRKTTKLAGLMAGAAGLLGGMAALPDVAHAATTNVWSCTNIHGTNPSNTALGGGGTFISIATGLPTSLTNTPQDLKVKLKADKITKTVPAPQGFSNVVGNCQSGPYLTAIPPGSGGPVNVGNAKAFSGALKGKISCNTSSSYPASVAPIGNVTLSFDAGIDPVSLKPAKAVMSLTVTRPAGGLADQVKVHGIVTKGLVPGADVSQNILQEPVAPVNPALSPSGASPYWDNTTTGATPPGHANGLTPVIDPAINPTFNASLVAGFNCQAGDPSAVPAVAFSGDGTSIGQPPLAPAGTLHSVLEATVEQ
jgi:hypothetical protein